MPQESAQADRDALPSYVLITPARNEEDNLPRLIACMAAQTVRPLRWVIVNDGSSDGSAQILRQAEKEYPWIKAVDMPQHRDRSFAAKVHSFNGGLEALEGLDYDVIGNLDADVSFPPDYLEFLIGRFAALPKLGVAGTPFREDGYDSTADSFEGAIHVAGGCQMFRRQCFEEIGGFVPNKAGGVDWIAVTTARMKGWATRSFRERAFFHHRSLGTAERSYLQSSFSYGEKDYYLGGHPVWELFRVAYQMTKRPYLFSGAAIGLGYLWAALRRIDRPVSAELMRFHRREQMRKLGGILRSLLRLRKPDNFETLPEA